MPAPKSMAKMDTILRSKREWVKIQAMRSMPESVPQWAATPGAMGLM
jgi:hypothetical protein